MALLSFPMGFRFIFLIFYTLALKGEG